MEYIDRNTIYGFGRRVRKNYQFMANAREQGADVHIVTQLLTSLLGLLVFPYEHLTRNGLLPRASEPLENLQADGWPEWTFLLGRSKDLNEHLRHLRNALSHRRIEVSSDSRRLEEVNVRMWDQSKPGLAPYWEVSINGVDLRDFVFQFTDLIDARL